jgi:transcriptional regulator with GAF, ATPase, and Fis domain
MPDSLLEQVAFHYVEALDLIKGPAYAFRAAYMALDRFATRRAIELFLMGLNLTPSHEFDRRFEGLEITGGLLLLAGDLARAESVYSEMLLLSRTAGAHAKEAIAIRELARILIEGGEMDRGLGYARDAEARFHAIGDAIGETSAVLLQAQGLLKTGDLIESHRLVEYGYDKSVQNLDVHGQALAKALEGLIETERDNHEQAVRLHEEALDLRSRINDASGIAVALNNIGLVYLEQGRFDQAVPYFEKSLHESREKGLSLAAILASVNLGEVHRLQGRADMGATLLNEAFALAESASRRYLSAYAAYNLGMLAQVQGRFVQSLDLLGKAENFYREAKGRSDLCAVLIGKATLLHSLGRDLPAFEAIEAAVSLARDVGTVHLLSSVRAAAAMILAGEHFGRLERLLSDLQPMTSSARPRTVSRLHLCEAQAVIDLLMEATAPALDSIREMKAIAREAGLRPDLARAGLLEGQALLKLGRRNEARIILEQEAASSREMGLRPLLSHLLYWLAQAQEALGDARSAADSLFEAADLITAMADAIKEDELRHSYLEAPIQLAVLQRAERLERAGMHRRPPAGARTLEPGELVAEAFDDITRRLGADAPLRTLLTAALDRAIETIRADRGLLILLDAPASGASAGDEPGAEVTIARNLEGETIRDVADYCRSILQEVSAGTSILAIDAPGDERFSTRRSVTLYQIQSLMCIPLRTGDRVVGALYFDSRSGNRLFRQDDLRLMESYSTRVSSAIAEAQENLTHKERAVVVNRELARRYHINNLIGESAAMQRVFRMMEAIIRADCNVLVTGESGTGKELVARAIHYAGSRKLSNFVPLDCGALPETLVESELFGYRRGAFTGAEADRKGLLEEADGGTLFLDEIANTTPAFQAKLLRALQSGEFRRLGETFTRRVDVRIIAATNADIELAIKEGRFREDLYYRLNVVTLPLPPLRDRREDIPLLAEHFARLTCEARGIASRGISEAAMARLQAHHWPGNVRELEHAIEAALVVSHDGMIRRETLPDKVLGGDVEVVRDLLHEVAASSDQPCQPGQPARAPSGEPDERAMVEQALARSGGDKSRAARLLGWNRMRLYRRLKSLGIPYDSGTDQDHLA